MKKSNLLVSVLALVLAQAAFADTTCVVNTDDGGSYYGNGSDSSSALASARDQCLNVENNGQYCTYAPYSCTDNDAPPPSYGGLNCIVSLGDGITYNGQGPDVGSALASARDNCLESGNTSYTCNAAPYSCH